MRLDPEEGVGSRLDERPGRSISLIHVSSLRWHYPVQVLAVGDVRIALSAPSGAPAVSAESRSVTRTPEDPAIVSN
jgi:hypothetical protein